ncbi:MAG: hypothetical protein IJ154_03140 [Bacteroidales bacterium]|nr:hypothetical protein [Bacteroidales bacterium]
MKRLFSHAVFGALCIGFTSCMPKVTTHLYKRLPPLDETSEVAVYEISENVPQEAEFLGDLRIGDTGFSTRGDYEFILATAKDETRKAGGNLLKITEHRKPDFVSSIHRISANMYYLQDSTYTQSGEETEIKDERVFREQATHEAAVVDLQARSTSPYTHRKYRAAIHEGYGMRTAKLAKGLTPDERKYMNKLRGGFSYGADILAYLWPYGNGEESGVGIKFHKFNAYSNLTNIVQLSDGTPLISYISDDIDIIFLGLTYGFRSESAKRQNYFYLDWSVGYLGYTDVICEGITGKISGSTIGTAIHFGYDYRISEHFLLGASLNYIAGVLSSYDLISGNRHTHVDLDKEEYESLAHLSLSAGIRYCF